jgi:hypothetical protein
MKKLVTDYTFNAASKTITLNGFTSIDLEGLLLVTNVSTNQIIYNFADPALGATVSSNVLTLAYNTTTMSNTDALQIFYDDATSPASDDTATALLQVANTLKRIAKNMESLQVVDANQRQRVNVEVLPPTLANVTTVNNLNQFAAVDGRFLITDWARASADTLRTKLTFT